MTKTLTEQWREGTLPDGAYYILVDKYEQNEPEIDVGVCYNSNFEWWIVKEVLVPVPSYDDCNELKQDNKYLKSGIETRDNQIKQLEKKLEIATNALKEYAEIETHDWVDSQVVAKRALKEMEGVK